MHELWQSYDVTTSSVGCAVSNVPLASTLVLVLVSVDVRTGAVLLESTVDVRVGRTAGFERLELVHVRVAVVLVALLVELVAC